MPNFPIGSFFCRQRRICDDLRLRVDELDNFLGEAGEIREVLGAPELLTSEPSLVLAIVGDMEQVCEGETLGILFCCYALSSDKLQFVFPTGLLAISAFAGCFYAMPMRPWNEFRTAGGTAAEMECIGGPDYGGVEAV